MKTFRQYLVESNYSFSSTQINLPKKLAMEIIHWGEEVIPEENLFSDPDDPGFGREDEIHVTVLYGIHTCNFKEAEKALKDTKPFNVKLGEVQKFSNEKFDVIYVSVKSEELHNLNKKAKQNLEYTSKFPTYQPHITIAYVNKDSSNDILKSKKFVDVEFRADEIVFSPSVGSKKKIKLEEK